MKLIKIFPTNFYLHHPILTKNNPLSTLFGGFPANHDEISRKLKRVQTSCFPHFLTFMTTFYPPLDFSKLDSSTTGQEIDIGMEDPFNYIYSGMHHNPQDPQPFTSLLGNKGTLKRNRRRRTAFTHSQLAFLERKFRCQKYLSVADRGEVANQLNLSETQVKTWWVTFRSRLNF